MTTKDKPKMTNRKKIKIALLSILSFIVLMFAILVYHIANARPIESATIQVSRIDFDKAFDSTSTIDITKKLHAIEGVKSEIIVKRNVVVYFHDNRVADSKKVYDELMKTGNYKAQRFILPASLANKEVCPVMNKEGLQYKFSKFVQRIFN
ncbi:hypothetical protein [Flavobacterium sp.]|uniref:hypothetical protein n=1 Tax=Flavobacterium sp. TaxID=239 RepID=UPI0024884C5E|nr:hypothetical protein [Flavobacterium sp.]MDI1318433.1 hypothetical protein [Flavobacterium sp.]